MKNVGLKLTGLILISCLSGFVCRAAGFNPQQVLSVAIFFASVLGSLMFWEFRLSFAFIGTAVLLITKTIDIEHVVEFASLDVILFLIGMMVIVGLLKGEGFFAWIVQLILRIRNLTAHKFIVVISVASALLSAMTSEVVSIIFMTAAILEICDYFEVEALPYVIISVLATNIGSAATVLGNPIGILIASKSGLTFEDFIVKAFPLAVVSLIAAVLLLLVWYRKSIDKLQANIKELGANEMLIKLISVSPEISLKVGLTVFAATIFFISMHHRLELFLGLAPNTVLLVIPLISSGCVMLWKHRKARDYIEKDVEWWTLLFFLLLFVQAGTLKYTGVTVFVAEKLVALTGNNPDLLTAVILWTSAIGSSILDNVVLVAAFIPIIQGFGALNIKLQPLWWALLLGGCFGGNITLIGSTANIVAVGIIEKEKNIKVSFLKWFWVGFSVGAVTTLIVWLALVYLPFYR